LVRRWSLRTPVLAPGLTSLARRSSKTCSEYLWRARAAACAAFRALLCCFFAHAACALLCTAVCFAAVLVFNSSIHASASPCSHGCACIPLVVALLGSEHSQDACLGCPCTNPVLVSL
jgi:hypothetical protein